MSTVSTSISKSPFSVETILDLRTVKKELPRSSDAKDVKVLPIESGDKSETQVVAPAGATKTRHKSDHKARKHKTDKQKNKKRRKQIEGMINICLAYTPQPVVEKVNGSNLNNSCNTVTDTTSNCKNEISGAIANNTISAKSNIKAPNGITSAANINATLNGIRGITNNSNDNNPNNNDSYKHNDLKKQQSLQKFQQPQASPCTSKSVKQNNTSNNNTGLIRYLQCQSSLTVCDLKKFITIKFRLNADHKIKLAINGKDLTDSNSSFGELICTKGKARPCLINWSVV